MVSTVAGTDHRSFWSTCDLDIFQGCFFTLSNYTTHTHFENILNNLTYTNKEPPEYNDRFWEVCDMLDCWNKNMAKMFLPNWMNCIDKSMSKWVNEYTCPGFMFVPHKPWSLEMNTTMQDVLNQTSFGHWNYGKEKTALHNSTTNLLTILEKQWEHCYISQNLFGVVAESLFLIVAFVFSRQLLSYRRKVSSQWP